MTKREKQDLLFKEMMECLDRAAVKLVENKIKRDNEIMALHFWGSLPEKRGLQCLAQKI